MQYVEAPETWVTATPRDFGVFLGGGITDCPDWQAAVAATLADTNFTLLNPRRADFPKDDPTAAEAQIVWEHQALRAAHLIIFWFPAETLCPITLYELGAWSMTPKPLIVGTHPDYKRRQDVVIQTALVRPEIDVVDSLEAVIKEVRSRLPVYN